MKAKLFSILALLTLCFYMTGTAGAAGDDAEPLMFPSAYSAGAVSNGGTISGVVTYSGAPIQMTKLDITKDQHICGKTDKFDESIVVGKGNALQNTIVYLTDISKGADFPTKDAKGKPIKYEIDQNGCRFEPHIAVIPAEERLTMINSDGIMHNVHIFSEKGYNKAQTKTRKRLPVPAYKKVEGPVSVKCDVHGWMAGWIVYSNHPYIAVTNEKGEYKLENVPPGTYKVGYWHEALGSNKAAPASVTVEAGGMAKQDFTLKKM
jgi:plastocyanin